MPPPRLVVVGSANIDLRLRLPQLPRPGETLEGGTFDKAFGGKGANAAVAAARAGAEVSFVGAVGDDEEGRAMTGNLRFHGVETDGIEVLPAVATGVAFILLDRSGENMIGIAPGANAHVSPARIDALRPRLREAALILVQNEVPEETVGRLLDIAREDGLKILYNTAPARPVADGRWAAIELLVLNESEAAALSEMPVGNAAEACGAVRLLLAKGARNVFVTLGAEGVTAGNGGGIFHLPAFRVKPVDTVAAGDTFCGALAVAWAEGRPIGEAVRFAAAAAAISVTRPGAQEAAPGRSEIEVFLAGVF